MKSRTSAILIAAGESTRMGSPKPLLPWHGATLIEYQTSSLLEGGADEVVVVLGHSYELVEPHVTGEGVRSIVNDRYRLGKTTSIKAGLREADPDAHTLVLLAVDQPRPPAIITAVLKSHRRNDAVITSPRFRGHGGHPLLFSNNLRAELQAITEEAQGVREVIDAHRDEVTEVPIDDPIVRLDLNTRQEYQDALQQYEA